MQAEDGVHTGAQTHLVFTLIGRSLGQREANRGIVAMRSGTSSVAALSSVSMAKWKYPLVAGQK